MKAVMGFLLGHLLLTTAVLGHGQLIFANNTETKINNLMNGCAWATGPNRPRLNLPLRLHQNLVHRGAMHIRQPIIATGVAISESSVIDAEQVQNGRMEVVHVNFILCDR